MADRVCMMTNGPKARVGQVLELPFHRPRKRAEVLEHALYYDLRGCLVEFLEDQDHRAKPQLDEPEPSSDETLRETLRDSQPDLPVYTGDLSAMPTVVEKLA